MNKLHKMIDKLIEIRVTSDLSPEAFHNLDFVIEELMDDAGIIPDYRDLSPEEMEEIKQFESVLQGLMSHRMAMA